MDVALVTCSRLEDLAPDDRCLLELLPARGLSVGARVWNDPAVDWGEARLTLLRSPWDYHLRHGEFLAWAERVSRESRLVNPLAVVRWNTHKGYLRELARLKVPVVSTEYVPAGSGFVLRERMAALRWATAVVKPAVSCDSWGTLRADSASEASMAAAQAHLDALLPEREMMVQPYLPGVTDPGERSLVFIEGQFSHAARKAPPAFGGDDVGGEGAPVRAEADELDVARRALAACGHGPLLYARVDLVRDESGAPLLMELELVEPSLFLAQAPEGRARLVDGIVARLEGRA
jgi:hypothetical protein